MTQARNATERPRKYSRWPDFENEVMRAVDPTLKIMNVVLKRQAEIDDDDEETELVRTQFRDELLRRGHDPDTDWVFIPSKTGADWYFSATGERKPVNSASRRINTLGLRELTKSRRNGSPGWAWKGCNTGMRRAIELKRFPSHEQADNGDAASNTGKVPCAQIEGHISD
ncbi:MAG: hypothetical protein HQ518_17650 [Rhodopirellula sp.]|nr:hypothetical protein [Rhodopirellula sp.]